MTTQTIAMARPAFRFARQSLDSLPAPLLIGLTVIVAGSWGSLLHATGATTALSVAFLAVGLAAALASIGGFAFGPICGAMLLPLAESPMQSVQVVLVCSIANQAMSLWSMRRDIAWRALLPYLAGGVVGVPLGVVLLLGTDPGLYPRLLGGVVVAYALWMAFGRPVVLPPMGRTVEAMVGLAGGLTGGLAGFPSGPMTIWCGLQGWDKARQRGLYQPFILPMQVLALVLLAVLAPGQDASPGIGFGVLLFLPASMVGTACGLALFRRMTDRQFGRAIALMLLAAGLAMALR
jgi:uncharacterized membrane protein YfcA